MEFHEITDEGNCIAEQVYDVDEFALYWKKMTEKTYISKNWTSASRFKSIKR